MVNPDFFSPEFLSHHGEEEIADARQNQVSFESNVFSAFPRIQANVLFLILEATFDVPAIECDQ